MMESSLQHHLYESREFADVTLVSDDYFSLDVHKTILSYSSRIFQTLLHISTDQKPLIYLKGVHKEELSVLVKLIYLGKASLEHDELQALSSVAKEYQIKQLYFDDQLLSIDNEKKPFQKLDFLTKSSEKHIKTIPFINSKKLNFLNFDVDFEENFKKENFDPIVDKSMVLDNSDNSTEKPNNPELEMPDNLVEADILEANLEEGSLEVPANSTEHEDVGSGSNATQIKTRKRKVEEEPSECNVCAKKFTTLRSLQRHHKTIHELAQIEKCGQCEKVFTSKDSLRGHIRGMHEPKKYMTCENCNQKVQGSTPYLMKAHRRRCLKLNCEFCKIKFDEEEEFNLHIQQHMNKFLA